MINQVKLARQLGDFTSLISSVPYARLIGMQAMMLVEEILFILPASENNIGNPTLPALHGGCIGGFMEN